MINRAGIKGKRTKFYLTCVCCLAGGAIAFGAITLLPPRPSGGQLVESYEDVANDDSIEIASSLEPTESESRPVYKFSVIPGGAYSADDLARAMLRDAVVEGEYKDVATKAVHPEVLREPRQAYVSYRLNNQIYWTKKKVTLAAGETVLSDGETEIRARCGNEISYEPMLPTLDSEPEAGELDQLVTEPAEPAVAPPGNVPPVIWGSRGEPDWTGLAAVLPGFLGLPGGGVGPAFPLDPVSVVPVVAGPHLAPEGNPASPENHGPPSDQPSPENPNVPSDDPAPGSDEDDRPNRPNKPDSPSTPTVPVDPLGPIDPLTPIDPPLPSDPFAPTEPLDPTDPLFPLYPPDPTNPLVPLAPSGPENAPVVPEPSTILLLGTGGGALLMRKFRSRSPRNPGGRGKKICAGGEKPV